MQVFYIFMFLDLQVGGPPSAGAFDKRPAGHTNFRKFYERGDFPIALEHDTKGNKIAWKVIGSRDVITWFFLKYCLCKYQASIYIFQTKVGFHFHRH